MIDQTDERVAIFAKPVRVRVIDELTTLGFEFGVGAPTTDGHLQILGYTRDKLESVQLVGEVSQLKRAILLCRIPSADMKNRGQFQGKLMIVFASLVCPDWPALPGAIGPMIPRLRKKSPIVLHGQKGRKASLSFTRRTGFVALKIEF